MIRLLIIIFIIFATNAQAVDFPTEQIEIIRSDNSKLRMNVELATTNRQLAQGLMFRKSMPENNGMLFLFKEEGKVSMWMKNTFIPLDMLFIDKQGVIVKIVKNTTPHSLKTISSDTDVVAVLEINAMMSDKLLISENDRVVRSKF